MELDDIFRHKHQDQRFEPNHRNQYHRNHAPSYNKHYQRHGSNLNLEHILEKLKNNKKLQGIVVVVLLIMLAIVIALIAMILPLIAKLVNYISQSGVQGVVDNLTAFLDKLWKGSGK